MERKLEKGDFKEILDWPNERILELVDLASQVKRRVWGNTFQFCTIVNAKSGLCDAGCIFCAQAYPKKTRIPVYPLVSVKEILEGAKRAREIGSSRYSIVASGRRPTDKEINTILKAVKAIKRGTGLTVDVSLGILSRHHLEALREAGVDRIHHNLETSERFYPTVTQKIAWREKRTFIETAKEMGFSVCSGVLVGMGEKREDWMDVAFTLREMKVDSVPINFLIPISGTPLEGSNFLNPILCLKIIALFRLILSQSEIRICGGRERNLRDFQALAALMANGFMVGGYLTRPGRNPETDGQLVKDLGLSLMK